jgi:hypothetical protein
MTIAAQKSATAPKTLLIYCPKCGHTLYEDMTAEKRFGVEVMLCPAERIRFTYIQATETLHVVKL